MRKSRLISLVMLVSFGLLGVGYAAWSQTLTINAKLKTASFDVKFSNNATPYKNSSNSTAVGTIGSDGHSLAIVFTGLYPGANAGVNETITNQSTVPVNINSASITGVTDSVDLIDSHGILRHNISFSTIGNDFANDDNVRDLISATFAGLNDQLSNVPVRLDPGQSCNFSYSIYWKPTIYDNSYQKQTLSYTFNLGYTQANN